jgi:hypothetical protein
MALLRMRLPYNGTTLPRESHIYLRVPSLCGFALTPIRLSAQQWPYTVMNNEKYAPPQCEFAFATTAAIKACDSLDGQIDGIISAPALCQFSAQTLVGQSYTCATDGTTRTFPQKAADVINKIWQGPVTPQGQFLWYGITKGTNFSSLAPTKTNSSGTKAQIFGISDSWYRGFLAKNLTFDTTTISYADFTSKVPSSWPFHSSNPPSFPPSRILPC